MTDRPNTRLISAQILDRVVRGGAYSNVLVRTATEGLEPRDRRFVQRLVFGALRHLIRIDRALGAVSTRPLERIDPAVLASLRIGAEELLFVGAPPHAAVDGAVAAVRSAAGDRPTGFVNAVLRSLAAEGEPEPDAEGAAALIAGAPVWMLRALDDFMGPGEADAFFAASNVEPRVGLRLRRPVPIGQPVPGIVGSVLTEGIEGVHDHIESGDVVVTDPASVAVGLAVGAEPDMTVADVAAAPGTKTWHLWDAMEARGTLVAADRHERRLRTARERLPPGVQWLVADATAPPLRAGVFDRVLLDAPCTGLGTLRRRPEIRHRLRPSVPAELGRRQRQMVEATLRLVAPGGRLIYSVCTVFREETSDVVAGFGGVPPPGLPGRPIEGGLLLAPHITGTDGMFISVLAP